MDLNTPVEKARVSGVAMEVLSGVDQTTKAILGFIDKTIHRYDVCSDCNTPPFIFNNEQIRKKILEFKNMRHGAIRYITEITGQNIDYCKEIMTVVELRHIQGPKGLFRVNETEYQYHAILDDSNKASSNLKEVVNQQQVVFDALWSKAVPATERIEEITQNHERKAERETEGGIIRVESSSTVAADERIDTVLDNIESLQQAKKKITIQNQQSKNGPQDLVSKRLQLLSNSTSNQYAIRLGNESRILAATNKEIDSAQYTNLIEEADYLEDLKYDWGFTLNHWIKNRYHHNKVPNSKKESPSHSSTSAISKISKGSEK